MPNHVPVADDDAYTTAEDTALTIAAPGLVANDTDGDEDPLTAKLVSDPEHGTLSLDRDGSFTYTAEPNYSGPVEFTYRADDGHDPSAPATVKLEVTPVNDPPSVTVAAAVSCGADDRSGTVRLQLADVDDPATALTLSAQSSNATLLPVGNIAFDGTGERHTAHVTATAGRSGSATATITVSDGTTTSSVDLSLQAGGNGPDTLEGTAGSDVLLGQNGIDTLTGLGRSDLLCGGRGDDVMTGGLRADHFSGGHGSDHATDLTPADGDTQDATTP